MIKTVYRELNVLYEIVKKVTIISGSPRAGSLRTLQLEKIVEKVVLHVRSILLLIDGNRGCFEEWDVALIASAARNIMDSVNLYFHIAERGISEDQKQLRFFTLYINGQRNTESIANKLGFSKDCERVDIEKFCFKQLLEEVKALPSFIALTSDEQAQVLSGCKAAFRLQSPGILDLNTESAVFNLLSNSIHGLFVGLGNNSINANGVFSGFFGVIRLMIVSLLIARLYTARMVKDYLDLRKKLYRLLNAEEKQMLKNFCSSDDLDTYLQQIRTEYESPIFNKCVLSALLLSIC